MQPTSLVKLALLTKGFRFVDFCAGIGSGHEAATNMGGVCVGFSEIDAKAKNTYQLLHGDWPDLGDLTKLDPAKIPDFDLMMAGFPCQTFSILGKRDGMKDGRGMIIQYLGDILKQKQPKTFLFENVKGLVNHDGGRTLKIVIQILEEAGYDVNWKMYSSKFFGVPQKRERVYFLGVRKGCGGIPELPQKPVSGVSISDLLTGKYGKKFAPSQETWLDGYLKNRYNLGKKTRFDLTKLDSEKIIDIRQSDLRIFDGHCPTLRKGRQGLLYVRNGIIYNVTGVEGLMLQGFPETKSKSVRGQVSDTALLGQAGNAFTVQAIEAILKGIVL